MSEIDGALTFEDSLSIFTLIDSILQYGVQRPDQLGIRIAYNSNVLSAGRTLGIENFGLSPGLSYYHHTGLYADVSGYWSKDFDPLYYLTVASVGYIGSLSRWFSVMGGYDRYFYNNAKADAYIPYRNTLSVAPMFDVKPVMFAINYAFYFGDSHVHRIMPNINLILVKRNLFKIERITLAPAVYMLMGNEILIDIELVLPRNDTEAKENIKKYGTPYGWKETERSVFGIMNYTFSLPLTVSHKNWSFMFTYSYNIPKALPDEPLTLSNSSYLSGSLMYFINFRRNKSAL
jgi:hypothetical protein